MAFIEYGTIFALGAIGYGAVEVLYRGYTHWTMPLVGGLCFLGIYLITVRSRDKIWKKLIMCGAVITTVEFGAGILINYYLGWDVWNYSSMYANLMGQICLLFSLYWIIISIPCMAFCNLIKRFLFAYTR